MRQAVRLLLLPAVAALTVLAGTSAATAAPAPSVTCSGALPSGSYTTVTVSGVCLVPNGADVMISGGMNLLPGSQLVAFFTSQRMNIHGNVVVGAGAVLALGCTPEFGCDSPAHPPSQDVVHGNIVARNALSMYLNGDTIYGNVSFVGGGWGPTCTDPNAQDPSDPIGHSLAVKDNTIRGTVTLQGWSGCWIGFVRNSVHGVVRIADNYANQSPANFQGADSTEVVSNTIWGVLSCSGNTPAAQVGDSGGTPSVVHGIVTGECAHLTPAAPAP
jgi:hypothetical protein